MSAAAPRRCPHARDLPAWVDRDLDVDAALRFETHLAHCRSCADAVATQQRLDEALANLPQPRSSGPERERLRAAIRDRSAAPAPLVAAPPGRSWIVSPASRFAAAAALLLLGAIAAWHGANRGSGRDTQRDEIALAPTEPTAPVPPLPAASTGTAAASGTAATEAPASAFTAPPTESLRAAPSDEVAAIVRRLGQRHAAAEGGDLLTNFLIAAAPLADRGVDLPTVLATLLHDADADLATRCAQLLAEATQAGALRRDAPGLIAGLERALHRPDRGAAMLHALERIGTRQAFDAITRATSLASLRERALVAMAASGRRELAEPLQRALAEELRRSGDGVARACRVVATLALDSDAALATLARAAAAGLPEAALRSALERRAPSAMPLLAASLRGDDATARRVAIQLAPFGDAAALAPALAAAALVPDDSAAALTALRRLGGAPALAALAEWRAAAANLPEAGTANRTELLELSQRAFSAVAAELVSAAADGPPEGLAAVATRDLPLAAAFAELALGADGSGGPPLRLALFDHVLTPAALQASTALRLARDRAAVPRERVLEQLRRAVRDRTDDAAGRDRDVDGAADADADAGRIAALLVLLYAQERETSLREGMVALGWSVTPSHVARVADAARRILAERSLERSLERLPTLHSLGP